LPPRSEALVAFDLDGTLLRGRTVCEVLAESLGRRERMQQLERVTSQTDLLRAREEMAAWYRPVGMARLCDVLVNACLAPGTVEGLGLLRDHGVAVGIASITWDFAVEHFARLLGVEHWQGTVLGEAGDIRHVWPEDKATWVRDLARRLDVMPERTAAVGDSAGDAEMLRAVSLPVFVGRDLPVSRPPWRHHPGGNIAVIAGDLIGAWKL
jgi:phosphoserine phosphatase